VSENPFALVAFPILEIAAFVDPTTVVIVGHRVAYLKEGEELFVLGVGDINIPKTDVPLVVPKVSLEVTATAGVYAVARTPAEVTLVQNPMMTFAAEVLERTQSIVRRQPLTKDDIQFLGNPAKTPVKVGDIVVVKSDLSKYIEWLAKVNAAKAAQSS
jgi:hypothetical protein